MPREGISPSLHSVTISLQATQKAVSSGRKRELFGHLQGLSTMLVSREIVKCLEVHLPHSDSPEPYVFCPLSCVCARMCI